MEFGFTEEQEKLRQEVHDFFVSELPEDFNPHLPARGDKEMEDFFIELEKKAAEKGWPTAGWPKKYGGLGFGTIEQGIFSEEMAYWGIRFWPGFMGYSLVGPVILTVGTDEQKQRFVPPIARGEVLCFEAFTEPDAGSDEANVKLRAVPDGDYFVFNGQKTFISGSRQPDWLFTLARTEETIPKHRGLSLFMVPGDAPGITYRPLPTIGGSTQNEIFYDNVRVHKDNLLGQINMGFYYAMATFEFERAVIGQDARKGMQRLVQFCREEKRNGKPLIEDPKVREVLAQIAMQTQVVWLIGWHGAWRQTQRQKLGPATYDLAALLSKKFSPLSANSLMDVFGLYGQLREDSEYVKYDSGIGRRWEASHVLHPGGTPEIYQYAIAARGLGLPRVPRKFNTMINEELSKGTT